jgi:hypothetical protein
MIPGHQTALLGRLVYTANRTIMRSALLTCLMVLALGAQAQTFYYINNIGVSPAAPTTADPVTLTLFGDLSASNSFIVSTSQNVLGNQVQLMVIASSQGIGLPALVPHDESFNLGTLAAGTYTISINGSGVGDFAPASEHQFTVSAGGGGSPCDSLSLTPLTWHPFTDTALALSASNSSSTLFDYPGFVLLDTQGDTLAQETVVYFGIGQGPQSHVLTVKPGAIIPQGSFVGQLELWTLFYQALGCVWTDTLDLCPPAPCAPLEVTMANYGGAIVIGTFAYAITDDNGNSVASGTLELDPLNQQDVEAACLPPGYYTLSVVQPIPMGGQLIYGLSAPPVLGLQQPFIQGGAANSIPFNFYPSCSNGPNGIAEPVPASEFDVRTLNGSLVIISHKGEGLGTLAVLDAQGRLVATAASNANTLTVDISEAPSGLLLVQRTAPDGLRSVVRVMNMR